jgi:hydroxypyruvate isomerase
MRRAEQKKTASHKRKLAVLQQECAAEVAAAERALSSKRSRVQEQLPGIANMLQAALAAGGDM